ncbi:hypothetical protein ACL2XG_20615 [Sodalis sp. RH24]|uniref:hypothetical protein n=1 Tax=unclassified Sodalis (in: enterobacteria) TaxID=2636512 RepID=UPI0039B5B5FA
MNWLTNASLRLSAFSSAKYSFAVCSVLSPLMIFSAKSSRFVAERVLRKLFSSTIFPKFQLLDPEEPLSSSLTFIQMPIPRIEPAVMPLFSESNAASFQLKEK